MDLGVAKGFVTWKVNESHPIPLIVFILVSNPKSRYHSGSEYSSRNWFNRSLATIVLIFCVIHQAQLFYGGISGALNCMYCSSRLLCNSSGRSWTARHSVWPDWLGRNGKIHDCAIVVVKVVNPVPASVPFSLLGWMVQKYRYWYVSRHHSGSTIT